MRVSKRCFSWLCVMVLVGASGCSWSSLFVPGGDIQAPPGMPLSPGAAKPGWPAGPPGAVPGPNGGLPQGPQAGGNEQFSLMSQRMAAAEDDRKVLAARVKQLEVQLRDKDKALVQASLEIQEAATETAKAREDLQRWRQELETVRSKLRSVERDNKTTLEAIIRTLEQFLERERDGSRSTESRSIELTPTSR